jgi:lysyl-tRNA synthetase class 2
VPIRIGARILTMRSSGNKLRFYDVKAEGKRVQVMCQAQYAKGDIPFTGMSMASDEVRITMV